MTGCYSKLTRAVFVLKTTASHVFMVVPENWIMPDGIPNLIMIFIGLQFVAQVFAALCVSIGTKLVTFTVHHLQANGQVEMFKETLAARMQHYIGEHQTDWDSFVQPLAYGYNT